MGEIIDSQPHNHHRRRHILAFSGGVDSSLVAALLQQSAIDNLEYVQAVLGVSPAVPREQVEMARRVAEHIKILLVEVPTTEGTDEVYRANAGQACLACKTHLYTCLQAVAQHATTTTSRRCEHTLANTEQPSHTNPALVRLYNGTNADDLLDSTRVGLLAAAQFQVISPLEYITKAQVRVAAQHLGLPNHHIAASPCLRSRLALGVAAIPEHLQRIEQAERHVRHALQLPETASFRVRLLSGQRARLEVEEEYMERAQQFLLLEDGASLRHVFLQQLGFADVTLAVFRSGSVARPMSPATSITFEQAQMMVEVHDSHKRDDATVGVATALQCHE
jgi:PP-loop superfamily ATP-utilizing enzyme